MLGNFFRGLRMLRHPELVRRLGDIWRAEAEIEALRKRHPLAVISSEAHFDNWREGELVLGARTRIEYGAIIALGDEHNGYGRLTVGSDTWIGPYNNIRLAGGTSITIGDGCLISQFCTLVSSNHSISRRQRIRDAPPDTARSNITIGNDVWLGAGVSILPGVTVGNGSVIGAGSIVTHAVGEYEIWVGNPARKTGERPA